MLDHATETDGDLFDLANTLQGLLGSSVTLEDYRYRLLAHSSDQTDIDQDRIETVLARQASEPLVRFEKENGWMRSFRQRHCPIFLDPARFSDSARCYRRSAAENATIELQLPPLRPAKNLAGAYPLMKERR